ncbi:MAG: cytochrome c oxidase accessory protein CcoG, partial [Flavobacteriales bacterium]|nr:cytochrome c oxidase accessory protein CcoG [Flavobacteriales bacterium]
VVIAYDDKRGETRSRFRKNEDREAQGKGDCIDCFQCVDVCPTGIDIRNGTQLECTNCTACIDACNSIMDKIGKPQGLIRYSSARAIEEGEALKFRAKSIAYTIALVAIMAVTTGLIIARDAVEVNIHRVPGTVYNRLEDGRLMNLFEAAMVNKTLDTVDFRIELLSDFGQLKVVGEPAPILPKAETRVTFMLINDDKELTEFKTPMQVGVYTGETLLEKQKVMFISPI